MKLKCRDCGNADKFYGYADGSVEEPAEVEGGDAQHWQFRDEYAAEELMWEQWAHGPWICANCDSENVEETPNPNP
jgi:hypothetical protein